MNYQNEETDNQLAAMNRKRTRGNRSYGSRDESQSNKIKWQIITFLILGIITLVVINSFFSRESASQTENNENEPMQFTTVKNLKLLPGGMSLFNRIYEKKSKIKEIPSIMNQASQNKLQNSQGSQKYVTGDVKKLLKKGRYFDIHYFVQDFHNYQEPRVINVARLSTQKDIDQKRPLLKTTKSPQEIQLILATMMNHFKKFYVNINNLTEQQIGSLGFAQQLHLYPQRKDYHEAEYYYYDVNYNIGNFDRQLPLCLALVGKNNGNVILKMYESIRNQNYTNYRIAHVDDGSDDGTYEKVTQYLNQNQFMKDRTTFIMQPYERNALYNRHYANTKVCRDGDIIIDLDTDDFLVGRQVFQLVNSLYQGGYNYKGKNQQVWTLFLNFLYTKHWLIAPRSTIHGQVRPLIIEEQVYRISDQWRTTHLRTYLWKLYQKVNSTDYVDEANIKKGQFYGQAPDLFMMDSIFQLSAPKHVKILDQYVYFYTGSGSRDQLYPEYCSAAGRSLPIYQALQTLDNPAIRGPAKMSPDLKQKRTKQVQQRLSKLKSDVLQAYSKQKGSKVLL